MYGKKNIKISVLGIGVKSRPELYQKVETIIQEGMENQNKAKKILYLMSRSKMISSLMFFGTKRFVPE